MTYGKRQFENLDGVMRRLIPPFHQAMNQLLHTVDADSSAFNSYMAALKLPKSPAEELKRREAATQEGLKRAVDVLWPSLEETVVYGNVACKSDAQTQKRVSALLQDAKSSAAAVLDAAEQRN